MWVGWTHTEQDSIHNFMQLSFQDETTGCFLFCRQYSFLWKSKRGANCGSWCCSCFMSASKLDKFRVLTDSSVETGIDLPSVSEDFTDWNCKTCATSTGFQERASALNCFSRLCGECLDWALGWSWCILFMCMHWQDMGACWLHCRGPIRCQ